MTDKILGYSWDAIQRAQRGDMSGLRQSIDTSKPAASDTVTDRDMAMLAEHGIDGLHALGYAGVIDRLQRAGII